MLHRKSQKIFYGQDYIYFIVNKTHNNFSYFKERILCDLFIEELKLGSVGKNHITITLSAMAVILKIIRIH